MATISPACFRENLLLQLWSRHNKDEIKKLLLKLKLKLVEKNSEKHSSRVIPVEAAVDMLQILEVSEVSQLPFVYDIVEHGFVDFPKLVSFIFSGELKLDFKSPLQCNFQTQLADAQLKQKFLDAARHGMVKTLKAILVHKPSLVHLREDRETDSKIEPHIIHSLTALHYACFYGHRKLVVVLLNNRSNVNSQDEHQRTPLHLACSKGHRGVAALLLRKSADPNSHDKYQRTPLYYASCQEHKKIVSFLIRKGADPNIQNQERSPLQGTEGHKKKKSSDKERRHRALSVGSGTSRRSSRRASNGRSNSRGSVSGSRETFRETMRQQPGVNLEILASAKNSKPQLHTLEGSQTNGQESMLPQNISLGIFSSNRPKSASNSGLRTNEVPGKSNVSHNTRTFRKYRGELSEFPATEKAKTSLYGNKNLSQTSSAGLHSPSPPKSMSHQKSRTSDGGRARPRSASVGISLPSRAEPKGVKITEQVQGGGLGSKSVS